MKDLQNNPRKKSFILYNSQQEIIRELSLEQAGSLIKQIYNYSSGLEISPIQDPVVKMAFIVIKGQMDRDFEKYQQICEKNKENIAKRWNKKDTTVYDRIRPDTKHTDNDDDDDNDNDKKKKPVKIELPNWLSKELWDLFLNHRKSFKPKLTPHAEKLNLTKLSKLRDQGDDPKEIIEQTIANGWRGFFQINKNGKKKTIQTIDYI